MEYEPISYDNPARNFSATVRLFIHPFLPHTVELTGHDLHPGVPGKEIPVIGKHRKDDDGYRLYNGVGEILEFLRNEVDDNRDVHCSNGPFRGTWTDPWNREAN
jgi:hypothetical protein